VWEFTVRHRAKQLEAVDTSWGTFVDVNGDGHADVAVGAPAAAVKGVAGLGRLYIFHSTGAGLETTPVVIDGTGAENSQFASQVSSAGDLNGDGYGDLLTVDAGLHALIFHGGPSGIGANAAPATTLSGMNIAPAGDLNGDGYADLIAGTVGTAGAQGSASILFGGPNGVDTTPKWMVDGSDTVMGSSSPGFGSAVAAAGDFNGDGFDDILVGAPDQAIGAHTGQVYVYLGGTQALKPVSAPLYDPSIGSYGTIVKCLGDINGDGYADVLAGSTGGVLDTTIGGLSPGSGPTLKAVQSGSGFGISAASVGAVGDINGDGYDDVVVGAPFEYKSGVPGVPGAIHVFLASDNPVTLTENADMLGTDGDDGTFGLVVAGAGDVDGDGRADVLVGAGCAPSPQDQCNNGTAYLFKGVMSGLPAVADQKWVGPDVGGRFAIVASLEPAFLRAPPYQALRVYRFAHTP
jgi:hypothetical protein